MKRTVSAALLCLFICAVMLVTAACTACQNPMEESSGSGGLSSMVSDFEEGRSDMMSDVESSLESFLTPEDESSALESDLNESSLLPESSEEAAPTGAVLDISALDLSGLDALENEKKGWGQGVQVDELNRPIGSVVYQKDYGQYEAYYIVPTEEKVMYLTFDEGYENGYTAKILDTLKEKDCQAVFFVTLPYVKQNPELVQRMIDEGHVVGNHSVKHLSMPTLSTEAAADEIIGLHNYMLEEFGYKMTLFRPPMGEWSTRTLELAKRLGYKTVFWSYAYKDYDTENQMGVDKAFPKVSAAAHPGALYLLHAVSKDNTEMLGDLIDHFRAEGYSLELFQ